MGLPDYLADAAGTPRPTLNNTFWPAAKAPLIERHPKAEVAGSGPLATQVGGDHYRALAIQPVQYIHANKIPFIEGNIIKYVTRWRSKGGVADLNKAKHFIELLIELEGAAK
jgi:hypothetical protein